MKKLFIIGLCIALSANVQAFNIDSTVKTIKVGQMCGDDCDGSCKPKPNEIV